MTYFFKRAEIVLAVLSGGSLIACWMNHPEWIFVFVGLITLHLLLNFFFFKQIIQKSKYKFTFIPQRVFTLYGFSATAIAITLIGVIFKQLFLDGVNLLLLCGMGMMALSIIIHALIFGISKKKNAVNIVKRLFIYFMIGAIFYFIPNSLFVHLNLRKYPEYAKLVEEYLNNPDDFELRKRVEKARAEFYNF